MKQFAHHFVTYTPRSIDRKKISLMPACLAVCNLKSIIICDSIHSIPPCATAFTYHKHTAAALSRWKNFFLFLVEIFISHAAIISSTLISSLNSTQCGSVSLKRKFLR